MEFSIFINCSRSSLNSKILRYSSTNIGGGVTGTEALTTLPPIPVMSDDAAVLAVVGVVDVAAAHLTVCGVSLFFSFLATV